MTPEQHIANAEAAMEAAGEFSGDGFREDASLEALLAIGHALIALAVESGVPHQSAASQETSND